VVAREGANERIVVNPLAQRRWLTIGYRSGILSSFDMASMPSDQERRQWARLASRSLPAVLISCAEARRKRLVFVWVYEPHPRLMDQLRIAPLVGSKSRLQPAANGLDHGTSQRFVPRMCDIKRLLTAGQSL